MKKLYSAVISLVLLLSIITGAKYCVFAQSNNSLNGWVTQNESWSYYIDGEKVKNSWIKDSAGWCYLGADGTCVSNKWVKDSVGWCYVGADYHLAFNCWVKDSIGWCYLGNDGYIVTDQWVADSIGWCYVDADGYSCVDTWIKDGFFWYYLDSNARMSTNQWIRDSVGWCYVDQNGVCQKDYWAKDSIGWLWLDGNGYPLTNNSVIVDNVEYYFDSQGYITKTTDVSNGSISAPSAKYACYSNNGYSVQYTATQNAQCYYIYRSTSANGGYQYIGSSNTSSFVDKTANLNKIYYYKIKAVNKSQNIQSCISNAVKTPVDSQRNTWEYSDSVTNVEINKKITYINNQKVVYWVACVKTSPDKAKTALAGGDFNSCCTLRQSIETLAINNNALLAINGDACGYMDINSDSDWIASLNVKNGKLSYPVKIKSNHLNSTKDIGVKNSKGEFYILDTSTLASTDEQYITQTLGITDTYFFNTYLVKEGKIKPYLINNGNYGITPSTAIGQKADGTWLYIVADGYGNNDSAGASMPQMAEFMKQEGADNAVILDGGSSSAIWFSGSKLNAGASQYLSDIVYIEQ